MNFKVNFDSEKMSDLDSAIEAMYEALKLLSAAESSVRRLMHEIGDIEIEESPE